jgi:gluconolactonase
VFDHEGRGYISWGKSITQFTLDGKHSVWAETGAPNGHKILADGTHLVCDASRHAVLRLSAEGSCSNRRRRSATASRSAGRTT